MVAGAAGSRACPFQIRPNSDRSRALPRVEVQASAQTPTGHPLPDRASGARVLTFATTEPGDLSDVVTVPGKWLQCPSLSDT
jgi:hypothetical protein